MGLELGGGPGSWLRVSGWQPARGRHSSLPPPVDSHRVLPAPPPPPRRPYKVWRHVIGTDPSQDQCVYHETGVAGGWLGGRMGGRIDGQCGLAQPVGCTTRQVGVYGWATGWVRGRAGARGCARGHLRLAGRLGWGADRRAAGSRVRASEAGLPARPAGSAHCPPLPPTARLPPINRRRVLHRAGPVPHRAAAVHPRGWAGGARGRQACLRAACVRRRGAARSRRPQARRPRRAHLAARRAPPPPPPITPCPPDLSTRHPACRIDATRPGSAFTRSPPPALLRSPPNVTQAPPSPRTCATCGRTTRWASGAWCCPAWRTRWVRGRGLSEVGKRAGVLCGGRDGRPATPRPAFQYSSSLPLNALRRSTLWRTGGTSSSSPSGGWVGGWVGGWWAGGWSRQAKPQQPAPSPPWMQRSTAQAAGAGARHRSASLPSLHRRDSAKQRAADGLPPRWAATD